MKRMLRKVMVLVLVLALLGTSATVGAVDAGRTKALSFDSETDDILAQLEKDNYNVDYDGSSALNAIFNLMAFQNDKNWEKRADGFSDKALLGYESESDRTFLLSNINSVTLLDYYELDDSDYDASFVLKLDYSVKNESRRYINGINYMLVHLNEDEGKWKVADHRVADTETLRSIASVKRNGIQDSSIEDAITKFNSRMTDGSIINHQGAVVDKIELTVATQSNVMAPLDVGPYNYPPVYIIVKLTKPGNASYHGVSTNSNINMSFITYCRGVLPSEWYPSWHTESLRAGAILVKNYAWYYILTSQYSYDVTDSSASHQSYDTSKIGTSSTDTAVYDMWYNYMTKNGSIWSINYGSTTQNNTNTWANQGYNWIGILQKIYPSSTGVTIWVN